MKQNSIVEAALAERQEYLEELASAHKLIEQQIKNVQQDIDKLLLKILHSNK